MLGTTSSERWAGVWALAGGMALLYVNTTMVNVALPDLGSSIHAGNRALQWIVSSYTLGFLAALLPGGLLGDSIGHRRLLLIGVCLFGVGAAVPLFSPTVIGLLVGRAVMGLGASVFTPMSLALIPWLVQAPYRARATAIWSAAGSLGAPLGPILGGLAIDNWGWKAMFAIDFVGALALVMVLAACIPPDPMRPVRRAAPAPQILLSTAGFILITAGLINSPGGYMATTSGIAALIVCLVVDSRTQSPLADFSASSCNSPEGRSDPVAPGRLVPAQESPLPHVRHGPHGGQLRSVRRVVHRAGIHPERAGTLGRCRGADAAPHGSGDWTGVLRCCPRVQASPKRTTSPPQRSGPDRDRDGHRRHQGRLRRCADHGGTDTLGIGAGAFSIICSCARHGPS